MPCLNVHHARSIDRELGSMRERACLGVPDSLPQGPCPCGRLPYLLSLIVRRAELQAILRRWRATSLAESNTPP